MKLADDADFRKSLGRTVDGFGKLQDGFGRAVLAEPGLRRAITEDLDTFLKAAEMGKVQEFGKMTEFEKTALRKNDDFRKAVFEKTVDFEKSSFGRTAGE